MISAYPGETVTLSRGHILLAASYIQYVIFDGLIIDNQNSGINEVVSTNNGANHVRIRNCEIKNGSHQGIGLFGTGGYHEIINNLIHNNGSTQGLDHGIYVKENNVLIERNKFYANYCSGVQIYTAQNAIIRGNDFFGNGVGGNGTNGDCFGVVSYGSGHQIYNNIVRDHPGANSGIYLRDGGQKVFFNTIYRNAIGITIGSGAGGSEVRNNIVYQNSASINGSATQSHNLFSDPKFVNASAGDFHLQAGSPAISAGVAVSGVTTDKDGRPRPNPPSIGAYESGSSVPSPPTNLVIIPESSDLVYPVPQQQQPPASTSQPSGPSTSQIATPFLVAGVVVAALLLSD